jgi:flagellar hook-associated protein 1 FlgK
VEFSTNILGSLQLARRGLVSQQIVLDTVGHNLANSATPGYTRQRAELVPVPNRGGVDVADIRRMRDRFLDFVVLNEQGSLGKSAAREGVLQRLQGLFNDAPGTGVGAMLDQMFQAFQDLSVSPTDQTVRAAVVDRAGRLTDTFRQLRSRVVQIQDDVATEIQQQVTRANALMSAIAEANGEIRSLRGGPTPNDLLDQRDRLVAELTQIVGVTAMDREDGTVQLAMTGTGILLVDDNSTAPLVATLDVATDTVTVTAGAASLPVAPRSGALAALVELRNASGDVLKRALADLDALANAVITEVNRVHAAGAGLRGHTTLASTRAVTSAAAPLGTAGLGVPLANGSFQVIVHDATGAVVSTVTVAVDPAVTTLDDVQAAVDADADLTATVSGGTLTITAGAGRTFVVANDTAGALGALGLNAFFTGSTAADIAVASLVANDVRMIAAGRADAAGLIHVGDGTNALALARVRTALVMDGGTSSLGDFFAGAVGRVGSDARDAIETLARQQGTLEVARGLQQQQSGVSTDEELISLTQAQTAYAAAARFATTIDEVIQTLLGMAS